jgi:nucleoid DNA-binding protein
LLITRMETTPCDRTLPGKFYALKVNESKMGVLKMSQRIAEIATVSSIDVMASIEAFLKLVPESLAGGDIVQSGDFRRFYLTLKSEGTETEEDFTTARINGYPVGFRPGKLFKQTLDGADYVKG